MYNSISALVTVIDCDKVILSAQKEKSSLELRKANLIERQENFAEASVNRDYVVDFVYEIQKPKEFACSRKF